MSKRPPCEVADILRIHGKQFLDQHGKLLDAGHLRVLHAIENCRTAVLGGHVDACNRCGHRAIFYNSCRNRHCPKCQGAVRERWLAERTSELLPVPYFHVVFTLPQFVAPLALQNRRAIYGILFKAAAETLLEVAANPKHLGAEIGFLAVLHTWGQQLQHHPHLHCVVPGGGLSLDKTGWLPSKSRFLLPVKVLSRVFRGKFVGFLRRAHRKGKLQLHGTLAKLKSEDGLKQFLDQAYACDWVVYAKPPFGGPEQVLRYLSRYTHRVAISNHRILSMTDGKVTFRWKDYAHANKKKTITLDACEFLRRFSLHVLPKGFVRIRHFGFLANRQRKVALATCRRHLRQMEATPAQSTITESAMPVCPVCHLGQLWVIERLASQLIKLVSVDSS